MATLSPSVKVRTVFTEVSVEEGRTSAETSEEAKICYQFPDASFKKREVLAGGSENTEWEVTARDGLGISLHLKADGIQEAYDLCPLY